MRRNTNKYVFVGNTVEIHTIQNKVILIDRLDFDKVKNHTWFVESKGYACGPGIRLHRFILQPPKGMQVDHINRNKLDNRRSNLRIVTNQQNHFNMPIYKNNSSGHTGVYFRRDVGKWQAYITVDGKNVNSRLFDDKRQAIAERKSLELKYFMKKEN